MKSVFMCLCYVNVGVKDRLIETLYTISISMRKTRYIKSKIRKWCVYGADTAFIREAYSYVPFAIAFLTAIHAIT